MNINKVLKIDRKFNPPRQRRFVSAGQVANGNNCWPLETPFCQKSPRLTGKQKPA